MTQPPKEKQIARKKCVLYARFSPRPDAATSDSCDKQMELCRDYAQKHNYEIISEFEDRNKSRNDAGREGVLDAIASLKRGWVLVSYDESRFGAGIAAILLEDKVHKRGAVIEFSTGTPGDDPNKKLIRQIMYAVKEHEREMNRNLTSTQMRKHISNGRVMSKRLPYGYKLDPKNDKMMVKCDKEQHVISEIVRLRDVNGMTFDKIVIYLNEHDEIQARNAQFWKASVYRMYKREKEGRYGKKD